MHDLGVGEGTWVCHYTNWILWLPKLNYPPESHCLTALITEHFQQATVVYSCEHGKWCAITKGCLCGFPTAEKLSKDTSSRLVAEEMWGSSKMGGRWQWFTWSSVWCIGSFGPLSTVLWLLWRWVCQQYSRNNQNLGDTHSTCKRMKYNLFSVILTINVCTIIL